MSSEVLKPLSSPTGAMRPPVGKFFTPDGTAHACEVVHISLDGATLHDCEVVPVDARIVIYLDGIGRFAADVIATGEQTMDVRFDRSICKVDALKAHLVRCEIAQIKAERRSHPRVNPKTSFKRLFLPGGEEATCEVNDVSLSSALVRFNTFLPIGARVRIEDYWGQISDRREDGFVVRFDDELDAKAIAKLAG
jgi:hypothetical protein